MSSVALVFLFLGAHNQLSYNAHLIAACVLLVIFTSATILDFLFVRRPTEIGTLPLVLVVGVGLLMGYLSSTLVGYQRHDEHDGGPSFGPVWQLILEIIYPICFSLFILCLSYLKARPIQLAILFAWITVAGIDGYFFDSYSAWASDPRNAGHTYESSYFPSETTIVTPLLIGTVLFWTIGISIMMIKEKMNGID